MEVDVEKVIRDYLPQVIHMSLATSQDNKPWVCEVHYAFDDQLNLYFRSLTARRHSQEIAANPNVAGNIIKQFQPGNPVTGVYFDGTAKLLGPSDEQNQAFAVIGKRFNLGQAIMDEAKNPDGHQFYKITVTNWYVFGPFDGPSPQKYQLAWKD